MKKRNAQGFTLLELLTVILIITLLAALIIGIMGYAQQKAARSRAVAEVVAMNLGLAGWKTDFGEPLKHHHGIEVFKVAVSKAPSKELSYLLLAYLAGPVALDYQYINDSKHPERKQQYKDAIEYFSRYRSYAPLPTSSMGGHGEGNTITLPNYFRNNDAGEPGSFTIPVLYAMDPFGNPYGYSSAGEFNPEGDLWSTAGETKDDEAARARWISNW